MQKQVSYLDQEQVQAQIPLTKEELGLLRKLNAFAHYQVAHDYEVRRMPAKITYKVNAELKLALVALLTSCSLLDPQREGAECKEFFEGQVNIIQHNTAQKSIDFGRVRIQLVRNFLIPEMVDDWILYRDVAGDGIHALVDKKTGLLGLPSYARGGDPVYEFSRFYRKLMEDKLVQKKVRQDDFRKIAMKALSEQVIHEQLALGHSAGELLNRIMNDEFLLEDPKDDLLLLPKK